jgi:hypothetical protein
MQCGIESQSSKEFDWVFVANVTFSEVAEYVQFYPSVQLYFELSGHFE